MKKIELAKDKVIKIIDINPPMLDVNLELPFEFEYKLIGEEMTSKNCNLNDILCFILIINNNLLCNIQSPSHKSEHPNIKIKLNI